MKFFLVLAVACVMTPTSSLKLRLFHSNAAFALCHVLISLVVQSGVEAGDTQQIRIDPSESLPDDRWLWRFGCLAMSVCRQESGR